jgi:hypothetical protein
VLFKFFPFTIRNIYQLHTGLNREADMKKTNQKLNLFDIDVKVGVKMGSNVKINKGGGGGQTLV